MNREVPPTAGVAYFRWAVVGLGVRCPRRTAQSNGPPARIEDIVEFGFVWPKSFLVFLDFPAHPDDAFYLAVVFDRFRRVLSWRLSIIVTEFLRDAHRRHSRDVRSVRPARSWAQQALSAALVQIEQEGKNVRE
jgi:hypothetical protein